MAAFKPSTSETAIRREKLAGIGIEPTPPSDEEVTRIRPYPGCILFAEDDGMHGSRNLREAR